MPNSITVPVRTHYYQFDQQGVAFNMWYLAFIEEARNGYLAGIGFSLEDLLASGHDIQLVHVEMDWSAALRYGDILEVEVTSGRTGNTSFSIHHQLTVNGLASALGTAVYVIIDGATQKKASLPPSLRAALEG